MVLVPVLPASVDSLFSKAHARLPAPQELVPETESANAHLESSPKVNVSHRAAQDSLLFLEAADHAILTVLSALVP